jgi:hypothetical protein
MKQSKKTQKTEKKGNILGHSQNGFAVQISENLYVK